MRNRASYCSWISWKQFGSHGQVVAHPSQTSLLPSHIPDRDEGLDLPGRNPNHGSISGTNFDQRLFRLRYPRSKKATLTSIKSTELCLCCLFYVNFFSVKDLFQISIPVFTAPNQCFTTGFLHHFVLMRRPNFLPVLEYPL